MLLNICWHKPLFLFCFCFTDRNRRVSHPWCLYPAWSHGRLWVWLSFTVEICGSFSALWKGRALQIQLKTGSEKVEKPQDSHKIFTQTGILFTCSNTTLTLLGTGTLCFKKQTKKRHLTHPKWHLIIFLALNFRLNQYWQCSRLSLLDIN